MSHLVKHVRRSWVRALRRVVFSSTSVSVLGMPLVASISSDEAKLTVSAIVLKRASLQVLSQPASVVVTAADIARGYVEVPSPLQLKVQSNSQGGYMLIFDSQGAFMHQTLVRGLGNDVQLDAGAAASRSAPVGAACTRPSWLWASVLFWRNPHGREFMHGRCGFLSCLCRGF